MTGGRKRKLNEGVFRETGRPPDGRSCHSALPTPEVVLAPMTRLIENLYWHVQYKKLNPKCVREDKKFVEDHMLGEDGDPESLSKTNYGFFHLHCRDDFQEFYRKWRVPPGLVSDTGLTLEGLSFWRNGPSRLWMVTGAVTQGWLGDACKDGSRYYVSIDLRKPKELISLELAGRIHGWRQESGIKEKRKQDAQRAGLLGKRGRSRKFVGAWVDLECGVDRTVKQILRLISPLKKKVDEDKRAWLLPKKRAGIHPDKYIRAYKMYREGYSYWEIGMSVPGEKRSVEETGRNMVREAFSRIFVKPFKEHAPELKPTKDELRKAGFKNPRMSSEMLDWSRKDPTELKAGVEKQKHRLAKRYVAIADKRKRSRKRLSRAGLQEVDDGIHNKRLDTSAPD